MFQNITARSGRAIETALEKRLKRAEVRVVELAAYYLDGRPVQRVALETPQPVIFVLRHPDRTAQWQEKGAKK
jgi:hypothetical protein